MSDFIPNPANYVMKGNPAKTAPIAPEIDITDEKALRAMARAKLVAIVRNSPDNGSALPAVRELLDRLEGKPGQAITVDANVTQVTVNANVQFVPAPRANLIEGIVDNVQVIENVTQK